MPFFDWFWNILGYFGLYQKDAKILFLGLDNAGKTTLLHMLKDDRLITSPPTQHPNMEELVMGNIKFKAWDLGGHLQTRHVWETYMTEVNAIVFVVDAADQERLSEAGRELNHLLNMDALSAVPFLVLGNKIDVAGCLPGDELSRALGLVGTTEKGISAVGGGRAVELFMCSIVRRSGHGEGFRWLSNYI